VYAEEELFAPTRILTTTVKVDGGVLPLVSVKTDKPVPKERLFSIIDETMQLTIEAPVKLGDIIIKNVLNTKANIVATKTVEQI
jgi:CxxC motif-containing protein